MNRKDIFSNIFIAISAQAVSLVMSFLVAFVLPKILNVEAYSFWQLFMFYISYVGLLHFGVNDGVYLKYGSLDFDKMSKESVAGQFHILLLMQILLVVILSLVTINSNSSIKFHFKTIITTEFICH
jgi:O-antigen/teichoic acid export membrane protein